MSMRPAGVPGTPKEGAMAKRGKVLRDPHLGPGLLLVEGKRYLFLEELWRSDIPAKPGLVVNVDFDSGGNLNAITAGPHAELDQERAEKLRGNRNEMFDNWTKSSAILVRATAAGGLLACWFFLTAISIHLPFLGDLDLTFWQVLGYLNRGNSLPLLEVQGNPDSGIFGFLAILSLVAPFLPGFWKDRRLLLAGILPLGFMVLIACLIDANIDGVFASEMSGVSRSLPGGHPIFSMLSPGLGTYLSASLALYLSVSSTKKFLMSRQPREQPLRCSQKLAA
jgi:hypothetical protein